MSLVALARCCLALLALQGCRARMFEGTTIVDQEVVSRGDGWTLTIERVVDGPDAFNTGGFIATHYYPKDGYRFIHAVIELRNDAAQDREFSFDRCYLDAGNYSVLPGVVSMATVLLDADRTATVYAGDSVRRMLVFSYPNGHYPTLFACAPMGMPLPRYRIERDDDDD